jgi:hypothetical protein
MTIRTMWRKIRGRLILELPDPRAYRESEQAIADSLLTDDPELAKFLLDEAEASSRRPFESAESIERRATTLQGAVAIATTFTLTGSALLFDRTKLSSDGWRVAFAVLFLLAIVSFVCSGVRALSASSRTFRWSFPGWNDIFDRARLETPRAYATRSASLLKAAGINQAIIETKAGYLNAAVRWFRAALLFLVLATIAMLVYAIVYSPPDATGGNAPTAPSACRIANHSIVAYVTELCRATPSR